MIQWQLLLVILTLSLAIGCNLIWLWRLRRSRHSLHEQEKLNPLQQSLQQLSSEVLHRVTLASLAANARHVLSARRVSVELVQQVDQHQVFAFYQRDSFYGSLQNLDLVVLLGKNLCLKLNLGLEQVNDFSPKLAQVLLAQFAYVVWFSRLAAGNSDLMQQADESLKAKTSFLANLSHEVRAPLGVILNATELVLDGLCGEINDNQHKFLSLSKKSSDHLLDLVNDVLDYAKIEAGKVQPQAKAVSVADTLRDVLNMVRLLAERKKIKVISREISENLFALFDKKHLRQILINLATNAVKYTEDGGEVEIWAEELPAECINICVRDTGVGISESDRSRVFKPFERLDQVYAKQQGGVGIGLSLARRLAELNSGRLDFKSELGKGTTFILSCTLAKTEDALVGEAPQDSAVAGKGERLLLLDSDTAQREIVFTYLQQLGFQVSAFENLEVAQAGLGVEQRKEFALLIVDNSIVDLALKRRDDAVVEELKNSPEFDNPLRFLIASLDLSEDLPILMLSSRAFVFDLERYLKFGVERCLPKPAPLKELANLCRQVIDSKV